MFGHIIHPDGCFCVKISALFVNVSAFTLLWTSRLAASEQNNSSFVTPAVRFQMVAKPQCLSQLWLFFTNHNMLFFTTSELITYHKNLTAAPSYASCDHSSTLINEP